MEDHNGGWVNIRGVVVFVNQFFWPDEAATSQILTDLVRSAGAATSVISGPAGYASGASVVDGPPERTTTRRVGTCQFGHGKAQKLLSYAGFYSGAAWALLAGQRAALVVTMTTPPLLGLLGWGSQRWRGARHVIWEMDVYPDVATALGTFRAGGVLDRVVGWLADAPRRRADGVLSLGPCMTERLVARGVPAARIVEVHNWANGAELRPAPFVRDGRLKVLYSGNAGLAHEFETFQGAVERVCSADGTARATYLFRFCGGGPRMGALRAWADGRGFPVEFAGYAPRGELGAVFGACDVGLVTQVAATVGTVVPSKTYGLLAAGRPVLYVGPKGATPARIIEEFRVGWQVDPGDVDGLAARLVWLRENPDEIEATGARARAVFEREFDLPIGVTKILDYLGIPVKAEIRAEAERRKSLPGVVG